MSARSAKPAKAIPGLVLGGEPRVDLLPPEVLQATKARSTRRLLGVAVVAVIVLVAGGYGAATLRAVAAQSNLVVAQATTVQLLDEQAKYSEAALAANLVAASEQTRAIATTNEIVWAQVFDVLTSHMSVAGYWSWSASAPSPWEPALVADGPLREPRVATVTVTVVTLTREDATVIFSKLNTIKGFADATIDQVIFGDESAMYQTTFTINLNADALADRFATEEEETE